MTAPLSSDIIGKDFARPLSDTSRKSFTYLSIRHRLENLYRRYPSRTGTNLAWFMRGWRRVMAPGRGQTMTQAPQ